MQVKLVIASGKCAGRAIPLPLAVMTIGRGKQCHLRPHCRLVSKLHCAIACWAGKVVVRDLKSCNGTFVNGRRIHGEVRVQDGDLLQIGSLQFNFHIDASWEVELPVPLLHPSDVQWLLECGEGSAVLKTSETCADQDLTAALEGETIHLRPDSKAEISAGDCLREYFHKRA